MIGEVSTAMLWREVGHDEPCRLQESDLKICDLCGALNLASNEECFVCSWRGRFDNRAEVVRMAMELVVRRHGRMAIQFVTGPFVHRHSVLRALRVRLASIPLALRRLFHR